MSATDLLLLTSRLLLLLMQLRSSKRKHSYFLLLIHPFLYFLRHQHENLLYVASRLSTGFEKTNPHLTRQRFPLCMRHLPLIQIRLVSNQYLQNIVRSVEFDLSAPTLNVLKGRAFIDGVCEEYAHGAAVVSLSEGFWIFLGQRCPKFAAWAYLCLLWWIWFWSRCRWWWGVRSWSCFSRIWGEGWFFLLRCLRWLAVWWDSRCPDCAACCTCQARLLLTTRNKIITSHNKGRVAHYLRLYGYAAVSLEWSIELVVAKQQKRDSEPNGTEDAKYKFPFTASLLDHSLFTDSNTINKTPKRLILFLRNKLINTAILHQSQLSHPFAWLPYNNFNRWVLTCTNAALRWAP